MSAYYKANVKTVWPTQNGRGNAICVSRLDDTHRRTCALAVHRSAARGCSSLSLSAAAAVVAALIAFSLAAVRKWVPRLISVFTGHRGRPEQAATIEFLVRPRRSTGRGVSPPPQLTFCNFFAQIVNNIVKSYYFIQYAYSNKL